MFSLRTQRLYQWLWLPAILFLMATSGIPSGSLWAQATKTKPIETNHRPPDAQRTNNKALRARIIGFRNLIRNLYERPQQLTMVYFWSTYCAPCVKKIHLYQELQTRYKEQNLRVIIVSLDAPKNYGKARKLIAKKQLTLKAFLYAHDLPLSRFIDAINPKWEGTIPYVMLIKNNKQKYSQEGNINMDQLRAVIEKNL